MELLATRDNWWMAQCEAVLLAEGIEARWTPGPLGVMALDVAVSDAAHISRILSELLGEELGARTTRQSAPAGPLILQPAFALALCMAALTLLFFAVTGPLAAGSHWFTRGAFEAARARELWRLLTAATLHADLRHAASNAGFFLVLAWAAAERLGVGVALWVWLATAVIGFVAALVFTDADLVVGASGGLFGLLGAAAAHAARRRHVVPLRRRERLRSVFAAVLLLAFTAFSREASIAAHLGGFVSGLLLGAVAPAAAWGALGQSLCAATAVASVAGAWWWALGGTL